MIKQLPSKEVEEYLKNNPKCVLLDVRSEEEWNTDGRPDLPVTASEADDDFREYQYSQPNINSFTAFQIKLVLKGTNSSYPPIVRDLRGIALAI